MGKLINFAMLGNYAYQLGGNPWQASNVIENAKRMPMMQKMMMLMMLSSVFT